jgi:transposase
MRDKEMALVYGVSARTISRMLKRERETGAMEPRTHNCGRPSALDEYEREQVRTLWKCIRYDLRRAKNLYELVDRHIDDKQDTQEDGFQV